MRYGCEEVGKKDIGGDMVKWRVVSGGREMGSVGMENGYFQLERSSGHGWLPSRLIIP